MTDIKKLTQAIVRDLFDYVSDGTLYRKPQQFASRHTQGGPVTIESLAGKGYRVVRIDGQNHYQHRIIFLHQHGYLPDQIDHIDQNKLNNRIENLRASDNVQNSVNKGRRRDNTSMYPGVAFDKRRGTWTARISINRTYYHIGSYRTPEEAYRAYVAVGREWYGEVFHDRHA